MTYEELLARDRANMSYAAALAAERRKLMSHPPTVGPANANPMLPPGVQQGQEMQPLSPGQAFQAGRASNPEEIKGALGGEVQTMADGTTYWRRDESSPWQPVDQPGFGMSDAARVAGSIGPETVLSTLAMFAGGPAGWLGTALKAGAGAAGGRLFDEGLQFAEGWQTETPEEIAKKAATTGAATAGMAYLPRFLPGGSPALRGPNARSNEMLRNAVEFQATHPEYPPLIPADVLIQTGYAKGNLPPNVMRAVEQQAENLSGALTNVKSDAAQQAAGATERLFATPPRQAVLPALERAAQAGKAQVDDTIRMTGPSAEEGATSAKRAAEGALELDRRATARDFAAVKDAAAREQPIFDLSPVQGPRNPNAMTRTDPLTGVAEKMREFNSAEEKVAFLRRALQDADPKQTDLEALKEIRTYLGNINKWDPTKRGQDWEGRKLYGQLTDIIENPVNKAQTPEFLETWGAFRANARERFAQQGQLSVQNLIKTEPGASRLVEDIAANPEAVLTENVRAFLAKAPQGERARLMASVQRRMLEDPNVFDRVTALETTGNKDMLKALFGNEGRFAQFKEKALNVSQFWKSDLGHMMKAQSDQTALYEKAIHGIRNADEAKKVLAAVQSPQDKELWQKAIVGETVRKVMKPTEGNLMGTATVDPHALRLATRDLKQRGLWDVLDAEQQKALVGLEDYYRVAFARQKNVGNSLVSASVAAGINDITNPMRWKNFYDSAHEIVISRMVAGYLTNPKRAAKYIARINQAPRNQKPWAFGTAVAGPAALETLYAANPDLSDAYDYFLGATGTTQERQPEAPTP